MNYPQVGRFAAQPEPIAVQVLDKHPAGPRESASLCCLAFHSKLYVARALRKFDVVAIVGFHFAGV